MESGFEETMERALRDAHALVRHLDSLGGGGLSPAAAGRAEALASGIEQAASRAIATHEGSAANGPTYQALEGVEALRVAVRGGDVALMRAAAHEILDHLGHALGSGEPPSGGVK